MNPGLPHFGTDSHDENTFFVPPASSIFRTRKTRLPLFIRFAMLAKGQGLEP